MAMKKTELMQKNCVVCGRPFVVCPPGKTSRSCQRPYESQYCSHDCHYRARYRQGIDCNELTPTQAAYIAGFLDGEGYICLINQSRDRIGLRVGFCNCSMEVMGWLKTTMGVGVMLTNPAKGKHSTSYQLNINTQPTYSLLKQIRPYMVIKTKQADLAIEFVERQMIPSQKADRSWQIEMKAAMQALNGRGSNRPKPE